MSVYKLGEVNQKFLDALGVDATDVRSVTIHLTVSDLPQVTVEHMLMKEGADALCSVIETLTISPSLSTEPMPERLARAARKYLADNDEKNPHDVYRLALDWSSASWQVVGNRWGVWGATPDEIAEALRILHADIAPQTSAS